MQPQNVAEYRICRQELTKVRACITRYVQLVVLASNAAFWVLAGKASEPEPGLAMSIAAILFAIMSTLFLFLLSYKFTSHNRYAGYCKLLAHERFRKSAKGPIIVWEIALDMLRAFDCDKAQIEEHLAACELTRNSISPIPDLRKLIEPFSGPAPQKDRLNWLKGWQLIFSCSREKSGSWKLPVYLARIFGIINIVFVLFAAHFLFPASGNWRFQPEHYAIFAMFLALVVLWIVFIAKLYNQMLGSETVEAFCSKFLPIRAQLLRDLYKGIRYELIGVTIPRGDMAGAVAEGRGQTRDGFVTPVLKNAGAAMKGDV
jgi:uncharacterized membrane protein